MKKEKEKIFPVIPVNKFTYPITMLVFQIIIIFVLPFLRDMSAEAKLEFISLTTCGLFAVTIYMLIANWKETKRKKKYKGQM